MKLKKMSKFLKDEIVPAVTSFFMYSETQGSALIEKSAFIIGEKPEVPESILVVAAVVNLVSFFSVKSLCGTLYIDAVIWQVIWLKLARLDNEGRLWAKRFWEKPEVPESILIVAAVVNLVRFFSVKSLYGTL